LGVKKKIEVGITFLDVKKKDQSGKKKRGHLFLQTQRRKVTNHRKSKRRKKKTVLSLGSIRPGKEKYGLK